MLPATVALKVQEAICTRNIVNKNVFRKHLASMPWSLQFMITITMDAIRMLFQHIMYNKLIIRVVKHAKEFNYL